MCMNFLHRVFVMSRTRWKMSEKIARKQHRGRRSEWNEEEAIINRFETKEEKKKKLCIQIIFYLPGKRRLQMKSAF